MERRIKIALVDDHTLFRTGLAGLLSQHDDFEVVASCGSGEEFLAQLATLEVDVVFMDISMPGIDGSETTRRALQERPELRIITLSMYGDEHYYCRPGQLTEFLEPGNLRVALPGPGALFQLALYSRNILGNLAEHGFS